MDIVLIALRWVHVLSAVTLVGGLLFLCCVLIPAVGVLSEEQRKTVREAIRSRWAKCVMITAGLLLLSGIANVAITVPGTKFEGPYHGLLGVKMLLALAIFYIASLLSGRSAGAEKFRQKEGLWLNVVVLLGIITICIGGVMRFIPRGPKPAAEPAPAAQTAPVLPDSSEMV